MIFVKRVPAEEAVPSFSWAPTGKGTYLYAGAFLEKGTFGKWCLHIKRHLRRQRFCLDVEPHYLVLTGYRTPPPGSDRTSILRSVGSGRHLLVR